MAAVVFMRYQNRRAIRRNKIFRDRTNPLDVYNDDEIYKKFRFHRQAMLDLTDGVQQHIEHLLARQGLLTNVLQVFITLRFYVTGTFQNVLGDITGTDQSSQ